MTFRPVTIKGRPAVIWDILLTLDSGLVGRPHYEATTQIPGGRPTMEQVAERVTHYMTVLWQGKLARLGVKPKPARTGSTGLRMTQAEVCRRQHPYHAH